MSILLLSNSYIIHWLQGFARNVDTVTLNYNFF